MAPIPDDNQEQPPHESDESNFSIDANNLNFNTTFGSESSDDEDNQFPENGGYTLLPQDPEGIEEEDFDHYESNVNNLESIVTVENEDNVSELTQPNRSIPNLPDDEFNLAESGASIPTVNVSSTSSSLHPEFLAKFPEGKVPSYMQVPAVQTNKKDILWNKKRANQGGLNSVAESEITKAMAGFSIPSENVPTWAKQMTDDQWHNVIVNQLPPSQNHLNTQYHRNRLHSNTSSAKENIPAQNQDKWVAEFPDS